MTEELLIVFVKNPELGRVKTRLAKSIGDEAALAIYFKLLSHAHKITEKLSCDVAIYYGKYVDSEDVWDNSCYRKCVQQGADLGERMHNAIDQGLKQGYKKVCLVGSDIYSLTADIILDAFNTLDQHDVVMGPAEDGGYYLIGLKQSCADLFDLPEWSTPQVYDQTLEKITQQGLQVAEVATLNDIDCLEDLKQTDLFEDQ